MGLGEIFSQVLPREVHADVILRTRSHRSVTPVGSTAAI